jgi:hypothetical protein
MLFEITIRTLRGTANYLLALNSAIEIVHQLGHLPSIVTAFSGINFITYPLAIRLTTPSVAALFAAGPSLFCTGIDRLLAVTFVKLSVNFTEYVLSIIIPQTFASYQQLKPGIYLSCLTLFCLGYSSFLISLVHKEIGQWEFLMVAGTIADLLQATSCKWHILQIQIVCNREMPVPSTTNARWCSIWLPLASTSALAFSSTFAQVIWQSASTYILAFLTFLFPL